MAAVDHRIVVDDETHLEPVRFLLKWSINNFASVQETNAIINSTGITMAELGMPMEENYRGRWRIGVIPCNSVMENELIGPVNYVSVFLCLTDEGLESISYKGVRPLRCHFRTRVATGKCGDMPVFAPPVFLDHTFTSLGFRCFGHQKVITHQELFGLGGQAGRLKDDCLHITMDVLLFNDLGTIRLASIPRVPQRQRAFLGRQLSRLTAGTDFVLIADDNQEFPVHRFVLMAHSPMFAAMLEHDTKEKATSRCEMEDVDAESVGILLEYVYGCETGKINEKNVEKVLIMADKYQMTDLRDVCEMTLANTITAENAVQLFALAGQRVLPTLKETAMKYIRKNTEAVLNHALAI